MPLPQTKFVHHLCNTICFHAKIYLYQVFRQHLLFYAFMCLLSFKNGFLAMGNPFNNRDTGAWLTWNSTLQKRFQRGTKGNILPWFRLRLKEEEEKEKMWRKRRFFKKRVCLGCVLYPTGSMQQLLNGRAALPDLYRQGRGFAPVHGGKKRVYYHHLVADAVLT